MGTDPGPLNESHETDGRTDSAEGADLPALIGGYWSAWHGLDPLPTRTVVTAQLGAPLEPQTHSGVLGGSPTEFHRYRLDVDGPVSTVWFEGDVAVAVQLDGVGQSPLDAPLEAPEAVFESAFGPQWEQRVYGRRGLVVHQRTARDGGDGSAGEVALVFGLAPFHADAFGDDPIRFDGGMRRRRE